MIKLSAFDTDKLKRCARIEPGFAFKSKNFTNDESDIPLVKGDNLHQGYIDWENSKRWSKEMLMGLDKFWLKSFDIVVAMDRPWVTSGLKWSYIKSKDPKSLLVQRVARIRTKDSSKIYQVFLRYLIGSNYFSNYVKPIVTGVNVPHSSGTQIGNFIIPIPPITFQKKIAAILSAYDDLIENNNRRIAILEKTAEEIYKEWFVRMRFPGHETAKFEKGIPAGWQLRKLSEICDEIRDGVKLKDLKPETKYIGLEHILRKSLAIKQNATIESVNSNKLLFKKRDILFAKIRPYLHKVAISNFDGACSSDTIVIRPKREFIEGFLFFTVFSNTFIELATISSKGTKMPRADWDFLKQLKMAVPDESLLKQYQEKFEVIICQIQGKLSAISNLKQTRDRLLTRLISGKLSVKDLEIRFPRSMKEDENAQFHQRGQH